MKITVSSQELNKALQLVSKVLPSNPSMPILKYFLFEIEGNNAIITATDLELTAKVKAVLDDVDEDFKIAIEGERLLNLLKQLPDEPVTLEVKEAETDDENVYAYAKQVFLTTTKSRYSLLADDADAFPTVRFLNEEDEGVSSFSLPSFVIKRGIQTTFFSILNDASRPNLNGVLFDIREDHLRFVSTDVQRLVLYRYNLETGINDSFILPLRSAAFLKALNVLDESVKVIYNPKNVLFKFADMEVISQLVEGKFPDYEKVMAFEAPLYVNIDRVDFLDALKRISIVSDQSSHYVELYIENNKLILKGKDLGLFIQGEENLRAETNIENKKVGFNGKLLSELLNNLDTVVVSMKMADEDGVPVKFEPAESEDENEKIEMMLVTMRLD